MTRQGKLYLAGLFYVLFLALIVLLCLADRQPVAAGDTVVGLATVNAWFAIAAAGLSGGGIMDGSTALSMKLYQLTEYLGYFSLLVAACFALLGFVQLLRRRSLKKVDRQLLAMGGLFIVLAVLYVFFEKVIINYRPIVLPGESGPEASFPSSHTMLTVTILGSVCIVLRTYVKNDGLRVLLRVVCVLLILAMVFGRLLCGCHWLTDILGGVLVSCAMLALFDAAIDTDTNRNQIS
jgi:undecaprenyl-diphosphatase